MPTIKHVNAYHYAWPESPKSPRTLKHFAADRTRIIPLVTNVTNTNQL